MNPEETNS